VSRNINRKHETCEFIPSLFSCPFARPKNDQPELAEKDIEEIIKWLEELWLTDDDVRKLISADDWLKFIESVMQVLKQLINN
jgi:hypothetical protein